MNTFKDLHWDYEGLSSYAVSNHRKIILPVAAVQTAPAGEGRGLPRHSVATAGEGDSRPLGRAKKNLAEPKVAEQPSERARASQSFEQEYYVVHGKRASSMQPRNEALINKYLERTISILLLIVGLCSGSTSALAKSFNLAAALEQATNNSVIHVPAGTYPGPLVIAKPVKLIGDPGAVIKGNGHGTIVFVQAPDVELRGLTICNSGSDISSEDSGIFVTAPHVLIISNQLNHVLFGIYLKQSPDSRILGNTVRGYELPQSVRGDGIRLWYSNGCSVSGNDVRNCRDIVLWFSKDDVIADNHFCKDRYGLHLMYDHALTITNNWLSDNFVGAFLMYSDRVIFERNVCLNNRGVSGYGLGLKNIDVIRATDNRILDNTVGIWMNSSPSALVTNLFERNVMAYNDTGLMMDPSDRGNSFSENVFMNNSQQVARDGDGPLEQDEFSHAGRGNYWSDYKGYPGADPAIGAMPYRVQNLFDSLSGQYPNLQLFRFSPAQEAIGLAAQAFPLIQPEIILTDPHPLTEPPMIDAAALPSPREAGLPIASLALLAGISVVVGTARMEFRRRPSNRAARVSKRSLPSDGAAREIVIGATTRQNRLIAWLTGITAPSRSRLSNKAAREMASGAATRRSGLSQQSRARKQAVTVTGLSKSFGRRKVLRELNFSVSQGRALAFWGGNGAGKSTTIKCILGLLNFEGSIQVGGLDVVRQGKQARRLLGYVPQELSFYPDWTVRRTVDFCARIKRVSGSEADQLLTEVGLEAHATKKVSELSGGMKQRLGLAVALLGNPLVLLLDEFTSNLDAEARDALISLLARQRSRGLTILFATHRMDEVQALADEVLFMEQGQVVRRSAVAELKRAAIPGRTLKMTLLPAQLEQATRLLGDAGHRYRRAGGNLLVEVNGHGAVAPLELLWASHIQIQELDLVSGSGSSPHF